MISNSISLSQKLPPPFDGYIELKERIYNPGDTITGKVHLELKKKLCCDILTVKLYGSARVFFTETLTSRKPGVLTENRAYEQEIIFVDKELALWTAPKTDKKVVQPSIDDIARMARSTSIRPMLPKPAALEGIDSGSYNFDFSFSLPELEQYTSFDSRGAAGCVRYFILLQATRDGMVAFKKKHLFPVVVPVYLGENPRASESSEVTECCNFAKGIVTAKISLKKKGFVPGELVEGHIEIQNGSKESIKTASLRIVQNTDAISKRPEVEIKSTSFETSGVGLPIHKVSSGQTYTYPIQYYIPAIVPNFEIPACMKVDYNLVLTLGRDRNHINRGFLTLKVPIFIGTHPTTIRGPGKVRPEEYHSMVPSAPPAYFEDGFHSVFSAYLPSYSEAVGG
ncbi:hypothetical protein FO519_006829 [Halicephalobus sp. NKZ332]|nr:hypothetical protein FO519_006829 [Halicephalobus sp. NKZ332]